MYCAVPEEDPELPVHCGIQCPRRIRSFPSIVLYSARGNPELPVHCISLYCTMPEEDPDCILQCQRRIRSFPSTELYSARGGSGASRPLFHARRRIRSLPSTVLYNARGGSGASRPLYCTVPQEDPELPVHCIIQCARRIRSFPSTVLYSARGGSEASRGGSGASRPLYYTVPDEDPALPVHTICYSARGGSGASRPLWYTVPEEDPECIIQCPPLRTETSLIYMFETDVTGAGVGNTNMTSAAATRPTKKSLEQGGSRYKGFRSSASEP